MVVDALPTSSPRRQRALFAWQGFELSIPAEWNPVALSGSFSAGHALLAELGEPRLGLRWKKGDARRETPDVLERIVRREAGGTSTQQVKHLPAYPGACTLKQAVVCLDERIPGRDVCAAWAADSGRLVQLVYHAPERDDVLVDEIVPALRETVSLSWQRWAVLDLTCAVPAGFILESHDLRAGDLQLKWRGRRGRIAVRQLSLADLVLQRTTLEQLVRNRQREHHLAYHSQQPLSQVRLLTEDDRELLGLSGLALRKRRFFWRSGLPPQRLTLAVHDPTRNRIVMIEADDASLARDIARTVGTGSN
ncbi:MAG TPA: hypothetical protein VGR35_02690 [Tepidisphaeraceae bacterium]|nr:hypothetical protein [Tepidisphaeraceae bacterium]